MPYPDLQLNDGNKIPSIAFGTGSINKGKDIHVFIEQALDAGFTHLDTAQFYANEESVGRAIRESGLRRDEVYVTTKWGAGAVPQILQESLSKLGLDYIDLYLIHGPHFTEGGDFVTPWIHFENAKEQGLIRSIGVSNFRVDHLQKLLKASKIKPAVNQIRLHPYNFAENKQLLEYHAQHGIVTEAYGSLAPITTFPGGPVDESLKKPAERLGITFAQVIFLWVQAKGAVVVTTSSSREHLKEYIDAGDLPPLTEEEVLAIDTAGAKGYPLTLTSLQSAQRIRRLATRWWWRLSKVLLLVFAICLWVSLPSGNSARAFILQQ